MSGENRNRIVMPAEHQDFWDQQFVARGKEFLDDHYSKLPPAPTSVEDATFVKVIAIARSGKTVHFEEHFAMPEGFVALPRGLYDAHSANGGKNLHQRAAKYLPHRNDAQAISDVASYVACTQVVKGKIQKRLISIVHYLSLLEIKKAGIKTHDEVQVADVKSLTAAYYNHPTRDMLAKTHGTFFGRVEHDPAFFLTAEYEVMIGCKLWYVPASKCPLSQKGSNGQVSAGFIMSQAKVSFKDNIRKKFQRKKNHGITIGKTRKKNIGEGKHKRKYPRHQKGKFIWDEHVKGWMGDKHKAWLETKEQEGAEVRVPFSLMVICTCRERVSVNHEYSAKPNSVVSRKLLRCLLLQQFQSEIRVQILVLVFSQVMLLRGKPR